MTRAIDGESKDAACGWNSPTRAIDGESNANFREKFSVRVSMAPLLKDDLNSGAEAAETRRREAGEKSGAAAGGGI
jgi:hypothetical protein